MGERRMVLSKTTRLAFVMLAVLFYSSCAKDDNTISLTAQLEAYSQASDSKLQLDDGVASWSREGEEAVNVNGTTYAVAYTDEHTATISSITVSDAGYTVIYPTSAVRSVASSTATVHIDSIQTFRTVDGVQQVVAPMAGQSDGESLALTNLCSVVRLVVSNTEAEPIELKYIRISSTSALLCGDGTVSFDGTPTLTLTDGGHAVRLQFADGQEQIAAGDTRHYYIVLPPFAASDLRIMLCANTTSSNYTWLKQNASTSLPAGWIVAAPAASDGLTAIALEGEGSDESPYQIANANDLAILATLLGSNSAYASKSYRLERDLDLSSITLQPLGTTTYPFAGTFDGNGHTLTLDTIAPVSYNSITRVGLFAHLGSGTIRNLTTSGTPTIDLGSIPTTNSVAIGMICAHSSGGTITKCHNEANITLSDLDRTAYIGGIVGVADKDLTECTNTGNISVSSSRMAVVGGVVGEFNTASGTITCSQLLNYGNISANSSNSAINQVVVFGSAIAGGIIGQTCTYGNVTEPDGTLNIYNCANEGVIFSSATFSDVGNMAASGGIIGATYTKGTIGNCYNTGNLTAENPTNAYASGLIGIWRTGKPTKCTTDLCLNTVIPTAIINGASSAGYGIVYLDKEQNKDTKGTTAYCYYLEGAKPPNTSWNGSMHGLSADGMITPQKLNNFSSSYRDLYNNW